MENQIDSFGDALNKVDLLFLEENRMRAPGVYKPVHREHKTINQSLEGYYEHNGTKKSVQMYELS